MSTLPQLQKIWKFILGIVLFWLTLLSVYILAFTCLHGDRVADGWLDLNIFFIIVTECIILISTYLMMKMLPHRNLKIKYLRALLLILILIWFFAFITNDFTKFSMNQFLFWGKIFGGNIFDPKELQDPDLYRIEWIIYPGYGSVIVYLLNIFIIWYFAIRGIRK